MDAIIRIPAIEFNETLYKKIKEIISGRNVDVIISVKENKDLLTHSDAGADYWNGIDRSIDDLKNGKGTAFTMEAFEKFIHNDLSA